MSALIDIIKPYARAVRYNGLYRKSVREASKESDPATAPVAFIVACGRSGTSVLGEVLATHNDVHYLFEPYHAWAAIDPRTDMLNLYVATDAKCIMDATDVTPEARARYRRLIASGGPRHHAPLTIEKTPINAMRIGYLDAIEPGARFVHIVRDGVDVCRSIGNKARSQAYRIAGKPKLNRWWGVDACKWSFLMRDGKARGYYPDEVEQLDSHEARGAYEWLLTMHEVERHRAMLGERLLEFTYDALTDDPTRTLSSLCTHLCISTERSWIETQATVFADARRHDGDPLRLPGAMADDFNSFQERFGFKGRAIRA